MESTPAAAGHFTVLDSKQMHKKWMSLVEGRALGMSSIPSSWDLTHLPQCIFSCQTRILPKRKMSESTSLIKEPWLFLIFHETSDSELTFENEMSLGSLKHFLNFIKIGCLKREHLRTEIYQDETLFWAKFPLEEKTEKISDFAWEVLE